MYIKYNAKCLMRDPEYRFLIQRFLSLNPDFKPFLAPSSNLNLYEGTDKLCCLALENEINAILMFELVSCVICTL